MKLKKALCLLLSIALILSIGMPGTLAMEVAGDDTTPETTVATEAATEATEETTVETTTETTEATEEATEETTEETTEATEETTEETTEPTEGDFAGFAMLNGVEIEVGSKVWIKSGHKIYKTMEDTDGYAVSLPYKIEIKKIIADDNGNATWYEFEFADLSAILSSLFLKDYKYVKAESVSTEKPVEGGQVEGSAGDVSVTVSGVPENVTLEVATVVPRDIPTEVFEKIGNHKLAFSIDITLNNGETVWQPTEGGKVTVTLDVSKYDFGNGEPIAILHEHDGIVTELGEYEVLDGKLTFETDGFSNFYGYTVDFEYDGTWYSIGGGSDIYLYELFPMLGIDRDDSEVTGVTFSDSTLLNVGKVISNGYTGETAWMIHSLRPFDTAETMEISFADGSSITLSVYDANYTTFSSGNYTLNGGDTIGTVSIPSGSTVNITLNGTVTVNGTISVAGSLTITGSGTLKRGSSFTDKMFYVAGGGMLTIKGSEGNNIVIDGGASFTTNDVSNSTRKLLSVTAGEKTTSAAIYVGCSAENAVSVGNVELEYVTMQNLYSSKDQSPAIFTTGSQNDAACSTVKMTNVKVQKCATNSDQAIMRFNDSIATLEKCEINDNCSVNTYASVVKAGGQDWFCQLTMENCTASGNYSSGWGGVVLWAAGTKCGDKEAKATIDNCTFTGNTARYLGGAISNEAVMEVKNTTMTNNLAMAGGGIATFPFTLTKDVSGDESNACGLTLGSGNTITNNTAFATGDFTPFSKNDNSADGDENTIGTTITYTGGGGGVWCYMNKENWTCGLKIGEGNTISHNKSDNVGGGVYVHKVAGSTTTLSITGATISENQAVNGGGVAVKDADVTISSGQIKSNTATQNGGGIYVESGSATVTGSGAVTSNTAKNGGGLYINSGSITAEGGFITYNKATGGYSGNTTQGSPEGLAGVGGGIFLKEGTFTLSGNNIGIYSNTASVAAADVYASGNSTTLTIPDVKSMDLSGMEGTKPTGWYADYMKNDNKYPLSVLGEANPGRYNYYDYGKVEVEHDTLDKNKNTFYCLTLGLKPPGYGDLTITKKLDKAAVEEQTFLFQITGTTRSGGLYDMTVSVVMKKGEKEATVTIANLPDGTYTITEGDWSWRYAEQSYSIYPKEKENEKVEGKEFTLNVLNPEWVAVYTNAQTEDKWLSGETIAVNWWGKFKEAITN